MKQEESGSKSLNENGKTTRSGKVVLETRSEFYTARQRKRTGRKEL